MITQDIDLKSNIEFIRSSINKIIDVKNGIQIPRKIHISSADGTSLFLNEDRNVECHIISNNEKETVFYCFSKLREYIEMHSHPNSEKKFYITKGSLIINGIEYGKGDFIKLDKNTYHDITYNASSEAVIVLEEYESK